MNIIKNSAVLVLLSFFVVGCTSSNTNRLASPLNAPEVKAPALDANVVVNSNERISGTASATILFGIFKINGESDYVDNVAFSSATGTLSQFNPLPSFQSPADKVKSAAAYKAVIKNNADVIVAPRYEVQVDDNFFFKKYTVKVTGYKGTITSFTKAKELNVIVPTGFQKL